MVALPEGARALLALEPHESVAGVWRAAHQLGGRIVRREADGYLVLTSRKVAFIQAVGIGRRRTFHLIPQMLFPLESLTELREDPPGVLRLSGSGFRLIGTENYGAHDLMESHRAARVRELRAHEHAKSAPPHVVTERVVVREVVNVPCRYCGALNALGARRCYSCGAPAKG